jgi:hypothetical protein
MENSIVERSKALRSAIQQVDEREVALLAQEKDLEKSLNTLLG